MARKLDAIVFDADGTLLDTREFIFNAYERTLAACGYPVPERSFIAAHMGLPLHRCYEIFAPGGDVNALSETHGQYQAASFDLIGSYEGLVLTLDTLRDAGYKMGICSSRRREVGHLLAALERAGIKQHCDAVVGGDDVEKHKPDPEGFNKILAELDVAPERSAFVGDTVQDIETGRNGGAALLVAVAHGFGTRESLVAAKPDHIVERLSDIIPIFVSEK
jgi:pyrophosphatase PpaX